MLPPLLRWKELSACPLSCFCSESFLQFKGHAPPPRLAPLLLFLAEFLRRNGDSDPALLTLPLPALLRCLMTVSDPQGEASVHSCIPTKSKAIAVER